MPTKSNPDQTTLQNLDPAPEDSARGFAKMVANTALVGTLWIVSAWKTPKDGVQAAPPQECPPIWKTCRGPISWTKPMCPRATRR